MWSFITDYCISLLSLGHRSASKPHLPAAQSGAESHPADPCALSWQPHPAGQQHPAAAAGDCAACLHPGELELPRLLWVRHMLPCRPVRLYDLYVFTLGLICNFFPVAASEIQMMALPNTQYVIAEASTPVSGVNSNPVKTVSECCLIPVWLKCVH